MFSLKLQESPGSPYLQARIAAAHKAGAKGTLSALALREFRVFECPVVAVPLCTPCSFQVLLEQLGESTSTKAGTRSYINGYVESDVLF